MERSRGLYINDRPPVDSVGQAHLYPARRGHPRARSNPVHVLSKYLPGKGAFLNHQCNAGPQHVYCRKLISCTINGSCGALVTSTNSMILNCGQPSLIPHPMPTFSPCRHTLAYPGLLSHDRSGNDSRPYMFISRKKYPLRTYV